jgi:phosphomevalonate kinase
MVKIVFLLGTSQSGKDTIGEELTNNGYTRIGLADKAKEELAEKLNIPVDFLINQGPEKEKYRGELIKFAEDKRTENRFHWIEKAVEPYLNEETFLKEGNYVFTDIRRISEIEWFEKVKDLGVNIKIFLVIRPGIVDNDYLTLQTIAKTLREGLVTDKIMNDGSLIELKTKIKNQIINLN